MLILQTEEEREVMPGKAESITESKRRLLLAMMDARKSKELMACVLHVSMDELKEMIRVEKKIQERKSNVGVFVLAEWDRMHEGYLAYRKKHPKNDQD